MGKEESYEKMGEKKMRQLKSNFEKKRDKNLRVIKKAIAKLRKDNYTIELNIAETMIGTQVIHIYARMRSFLRDTIFEQKYLFTLDKQKER